jgi:protein TonB
MFEDSTFESAGKIRTRSRRWMLAAFTFYTSILLALVLVPLLCPEALPGLKIYLMEIPSAPPPQTVQPAEQAKPAPTQMQDGHVFAPPRIPTQIYMASTPEPASFPSPGGGDLMSVPGGIGDPILSHTAPHVVHHDAPATVRVSTLVEQGLLIRQTKPIYPAIGVAMRSEGTVMLAATISKAGNIENLRVLSGPALLQQAAIDAVKTWQYRPYLLDGEPVEVETTVNVVFTLGR